MEPRTYPVFVLIFFTAPLMLGIIFLLEEDVSRIMKKVLRKLEMDVIKNNNAINGNTKKKNAPRMALG